MPKLKNIIIYAVIAIVVLGLGYYIYFSGSTSTPNLVASMPLSSAPTSPASSKSESSDEFLALLLNVRNIKLDDSILKDPAFQNLHDSSITLTQDGTEGRPNPFAQFGNDALPATACTSGQVLDPTSNTCVAPPAQNSSGGTTPNSKNTSGTPSGKSSTNSSNPSSNKGAAGAH